MESPKEMSGHLLAVHTAAVVRDFKDRVAYRDFKDFTFIRII